MDKMGNHFLPRDVMVLRCPTSHCIEQKDISIELPDNFFNDSAFASPTPFETKDIKAKLFRSDPRSGELTLSTLACLTLRWVGFIPVHRIATMF